MSLLSPGTELLRFRRGTLPKIAVGVLLFIPLIYGALYLWAFWAPDKHLDALPIALVNEDVPATRADGSTLAAGDDVVAQLLADGQLGWRQVSADDAHSGVDDGTYAFAVTIPRGFSASIASVETGAPRAATLDVAYNDTNGFLATTLGQHAMVQVRDAIASSTTQATANAMLVGLSQLGDGMRDASTAAVTLDKGAHDLSDGLSSIGEGAAALDDGASRAAAGAHDLSDGVTAVASGADELTAGLSSLQRGTATLPDSATALAAGAGQVAQGVESISQLAAAYPNMTLAQLEATLEAKGSSLDGLAAGADAVSDGSNQLSRAVPGLKDAVDALEDGAQRLAAGTDDLSAGASDLATGLDGLASGADALRRGASDAGSGAAALAAGADEFSSTLSEGAALAPEYSASDISLLSEIAANPVTLHETTENEVQGFGDGFAPFFIALATFVGALITWLILRPLPRRPLATNASGLRTVMTGYVPAVIIAAGQVAIMMTVLVAGVGLRPEHLVATTLFVALTTLAFLALQQMFIVLLGTAAGRVVSLVLLMLQLSSSGGTYPVETTPSFFGALHPYMPATYVVDGLRALIGGGIDARFWTALVFMTGLLVASLAVSAWAAGRQKVWTVARLHPELAL